MSAPVPTLTPVPLTSVAELRQHHSQLVRLGLASHPAHARRLLSFLARDPDSHFPYAARLLAHHPDPHPALLNPLFSALPPRHAARLLALMLSLPLHPDHFTFPRILPAAEPLHLVAQLHALLLKLGFHAHPHSLNALLAAYLSNGSPGLAARVFRGGGAALDVVSWTTMVGGLCKLGLVDDARELFDAMPGRNLVSWNAMMSGYVKAGRFLDALEVFDEMRARGVEGNGFVAATAVVACTGAGALARGREVHRWVERLGVEVDEKLAAAVVDMYCKCGCVDEAWRVFEALPPLAKGLTSWNCMIGGFAVHGRGEDAVELFARMEREGVAPDDVTLVNVLTACAHAGMVSQGRHYFHYIVGRYGVEPKMEHYGCMVDLYGRAGQLDEAKKLIDDMPMEPDVGVLGALLGACRIHGNVDVGEPIGWRVIELDPQNSGRYVLLANLLATAGRWEDVARVRRLMDERNVSKEAGRSMIEVNGEIREFQCGGLCHPQPQVEEVYAMARDMMRRIGEEGYVPDTRDVLHDIAEEEKETPLLHHSEKLAIAFGLLHTRAGDTMRITKNLRVCRDCHEVTKFVSRVFEREIVVRDRNRFHHFKDGKCSCKDYW
ncbi:hypothetical protein BS78_10G097600 [Paspalum vaginatum]|nr:hypothetical protein BS78_10G097600 [Paspalum vaginatum]